MTQYKEVLNFWFEDISPKSWWVKDAEFDLLIKKKFAKVHQQAAQGELFNWRNTSQGRLAEILILDQFSRNMYRHTPQAFAYDALALILAQEAVKNNSDKKLTTPQRQFVYMPYMHSESVKIHQEAVKLFNPKLMSSSHNFELKHKAIIDKFGRYPHRNNILGRASTAEELTFLSQPGSSF